MAPAGKGRTVSGAAPEGPPAKSPRGAGAGPPKLGVATVEPSAPQRLLGPQAAGVGVGGRGHRAVLHALAAEGRALGGGGGPSRHERRDGASQLRGAGRRLGAAGRLPEVSERQAGRSRGVCPETSCAACTERGRGGRAVGFGSPRPGPGRQGCAAPAARGEPGALFHRSPRLLAAGRRPSPRLRLRDPETLVVRWKTPRRLRRRSAGGGPWLLPLHATAFG